MHVLQREQNMGGKHVARDKPETSFSTPMDHLSLVKNAISVSQAPTIFCEKLILSYFVCFAVRVNMLDLVRPVDHSLLITAHMKPQTFHQTSVFNIVD